MICLPSSWSPRKQDEEYTWPTFWLQQLARYPHEADTFLAPGHTVPNGEPPEPVGPNTKMCCMLIREPMTTSKEFWTLEVGKKSKNKIHFLSFIPIYEDEMHYKLKKGYKALCKLLDQHQITELLNVKRPSVVAAPSPT